ncbi:hypothetical protein GCM10019016_098430 [Streptomyces prasinosporus]|uniref:Uncharacterized protein n=1 Tax=Streptomyces prasinosporus TaxID=68256 RepID=A0ABP6U730_9ACTN
MYNTRDRSDVPAHLFRGTPEREPAPKGRRPWVRTGREPLGITRYGHGTTFDPGSGDGE